MMVVVIMMMMVVVMMMIHGGDDDDDDGGDDENGGDEDDDDDSMMMVVMMMMMMKVQLLLVHKFMQHGCLQYVYQMFSRVNVIQSNLFMQSFNGTTLGMNNLADVKSLRKLPPDCFFANSSVGLPFGQCNLVTLGTSYTCCMLRRTADNSTPDCKLEPCCECSLQP